MPSDIRFLADRETKIDLLNNEAIAKTIVNLVKDSSEHPITIGVHGDWGAGKSSVLEMVERVLEEESDFVCLKFNGWQFQGFEDAKIAVIESIVTQLIESRSLMGKATDEVKSLLKRIDWLKVAKKAGGLAFNAFTGIPTADQISATISTVKGFFDNPEDVVTKENAEASMDFLSGILKQKTSTSVPQEIQAFRKEFSELLEKAKIKKLVVLIDDLDRCLPETAIETLEAVRLFMFMEKTAFIIGADEAMIEYSVKQHFPDLPESTSSQTYARNYLEKLIQVPMRIPSLGEVETGIYIKLSILGAFCGENSAEFEEILEVGRNAFQKPWENDGLDEDKIKEILKAEYANVSPSLILADQITPMLSAGTKGNPRQIKRFLNALSIRLAISKARNFDDDVDASTLAKLMLAELYLPDVFEHIAYSIASSKDGQCPELQMLEREFFKSSDEPAEGSTTNGTNNREDDNPTARDWKSRSNVTKWMGIAPELGTKSLKPYLFVIKDRKNYIGSQAPLPKELRILIEKLIGGEALVKSAVADIKKLVPVEVEQVFDDLKAKILASRLDERPVAMFGIMEMVRCHSTLQMRYVEMLSDLSVANLGPWAVAGHDSILTDINAVNKYKLVKEKWAQHGGQLLKSAAKRLQR